MRSVRVAAVVVGLAGAVPVAAAATAATPGPGTFTKITTPGHNLILKVNGTPGAHTHFTVSGTSSNDITSVDIDCILNSVSGPSSNTLSSAVTVSGGVFSTVIDIPGETLVPNCRLRAVPTGVVTDTDYLGSYTGPILYMNTIVKHTDSGTPYDLTAIGEQGDGLGAFVDAGNCGTALMATIETPSMMVRGPGRNSCLFALSEGNQTPSGTATASSIKVSGHNAYLPSAVHRFLNDPAGLNLGVTQSALTTTFSATSTGDVTVTESAPLMRCSVSDSYPPTSGSCPDLVPTGVRFMRVSNIFRGAHQIRFRDTFTSTNGHRHAITLQYQGSVTAPDTGATGYAFPGHSTFSKGVPDKVVTGLGAKAATVLVRSDLYASSDEATADTFGVTWSRSPSKFVFSHDSANAFAMPYSLTVPAHGTSYLGFAASEHEFTTDTKALAAVAVGEMVNVPTISSPAGGAVVHGHSTTVRGAITAGANGLPTAVTVNGHTAHLTTVSTTKKAYSVSFTESFAKHTIKVTAKDAAGNTRSKSIRVTNKP